MDYYGYDYDYGTGAFAAVAGILLVVGLIALVLGLVLYILRSIGIMTIARNRGMNHPWMIWIPVVGSYTIGAIADDIAEKQGSSSIFRWLMLGGSILPTVLSGGGSISTIFQMISDPDTLSAGMYAGSMLGMVGNLVSLAYYIITIICLNKIYQCYKPESATVYTVLSAIPFTAFMQSIYPFMIRNNVPVDANYAAGQSGFSGYGTTPNQGDYAPNPGWQPPQDSYQQSSQGYNPPPADSGYQAPPQDVWQTHSPPPASQQAGEGIGDDSANNNGPEL